MNILAVVLYNYPGITTHGGADSMLRDLLESLLPLGWSASVVILGKEADPETIRGVQVYRTKDDSVLGRLAADADCLITHLGATPKAKALGGDFGKPVVQLIHNTSTMTQANLASGCALAAYNSEWIRRFHRLEHLGQWQGARSLPKRHAAFGAVKAVPYIVVRPPALEVPKHLNSPHGEVTMVNLTDNKNPELFYSLAQSRPDLRFRAVRGGYDVDKQLIKEMPNVRIQDFSPDVDRVLGGASVVVIPSKYESYSRVAVEAMARGIPVIGADTPGLRECLGDDLPTVPIECTGDWLSRLGGILDDHSYWSGQASRRYEKLYEQTPEDLGVFESALRSLCGHN